MVLCCVEWYLYRRRSSSKNINMMGGLLKLKQIVSKGNTVALLLSKSIPPSPHPTASYNCHLTRTLFFNTNTNTNFSIISRPWSATQLRGVKVTAIHLRPGNVIEKSGRIYQVLEAEHRQRGRGGATMTLELRDVDSGSKTSLRFGTEEAVERVFVEEKSFTCLYKEQETAYLMDIEKFEQVEVPLNLFGKAAAYLKEEMKVKLQIYDGRPLSGSVPKQVTCSIKEKQELLPGSVNLRYVKALLDNGLNIQVPPYLAIGEEIIVNTEDDSYVSRA